MKKDKQEKIRDVKNYQETGLKLIGELKLISSKLNENSDQERPRETPHSTRNQRKLSEPSEHLKLI